VRLLQRSLGLLTGGFALAGAISTIAKFEQAITTVQAVTGATEAQFASLEKEAKRLGATTRFSATQAAEGLTFLSRAGFDVEQSLEAIGATLNLATAGALDLGRAADIASNVLKGFRLEAEETNRVVDVLLNTSNRANTNVEQLGQAMSFAAPAAAAIGVEIELAAAAVGALSDAGVQSTRAGTSLRQIFIKLLDPTDKAKAAIAQMGLSISDVNVESNGLIPVLEKLRAGNVTLTQAAALVGTRQAANLLIMTDSIEKMKSLEAENQKLAGLNEELARIMDNNLNGALLAVRSGFEALILAFAEAGASSFLQDFFRGLATVLRTLAANIDIVISALETLFALLIARKLLAFAAGVNVITGSMFALGKATRAAFISPLGVLLTALALTLPALVAFQKEIKATADGTVIMEDVLNTASETLGGQFTDAVNGLGFEFEDLEDIFSTFSQRVVQGFIRVLATLNGVFEALKGIFRDFAIVGTQTMITILEGLFKLQSGINNARKFFGQEPLFDLEDDKKQIIELNDQLIELGESVRTVEENFDRGFNEFGDRLFSNARARRLAEFAEFQRAARQDRIQKVRAPRAAPEEELKAAAAAPIDVVDGPTFDELLDNLRTEGELLQLNNRDRQIRAATIDAEQQLDRQLTVTENELLSVAAENNFELAERKRILDQIRGPQVKYEEDLVAINKALEDNVITQEEANVALRDARITILETQKDVDSGFERGFLKAQRSMEDFASASEKLITDAFQEAENSVVSFFKTGTFSADAFFQSLADNFLKLGTQQLFGAVTGGGGGGSGGLGGLIGGLFGGGGGGGTALGALSSVGGLLGFQKGADFQVGPGTSPSLGGADNRLVQFRAQDGERVQVTPRGGSSSSNNNFNINFSFPGGDADSIKRNQGQITARMAEILARANQRNN
jgi:TP901 family phage tail tape measure protein